MTSIKKRMVTFLTAVLLADSIMGSVGNFGQMTYVYAQNYLYYGTLDIKGYGWTGYNTGLNYDMTGGTAGKIYDGAKLAVIEEKINKSGTKVSYVYSEDLGKNCYVTTKYIKATMVSPNPTLTPTLTPAPTPTLTPVTASAPTEWKNGYYKKYGVDYWNLFAVTPLYLSNAEFDRCMADFFRHTREVMESCSNQEGTASFIESLGNGIEILSQEFLSWFHIGSSLKEQKQVDAAKYLLQEIQGNQWMQEEILGDVADVFKTIDLAFSSYTGTARNSKLSEVMGISKSKVKKIINWCSKRKKMDTLGKMIDEAEFASSVFKLYMVEVAIIENLQEKIDRDTGLYQHLELLKQQIKESPVTHFKNDILTKGVVSLVCEAIKKGIGSSTPLDIVQLGVDIFTNYVYQGVDVNDYIQAMYLYSYALTLSNILSAKQTAFMQGQEVTKEAIESYEFLFNAYLAATRAMLKVTKKVAKEDTHISLLQNDIDQLSQLTYDGYLQYCFSGGKEQGSISDGAKEQADIYWITAQALRLRSNPGLEYTILGEIPKGTEVIVTEYKDNWGKTTYNGMSGWISLDYAKLKELEEGIYQIVPKCAPSFVLGLSGNGTMDGTNVEIQKQQESDFQLFALSKLGNGYYLIRSVSSDKVLDVALGSKEAGGNVQIYTDNGTDAQKWIISAQEDNYYTVLSVCSGLALDVSGGLAVEGTNVQQWNSNGTDAQQFRFEMVGMQAKIEELFEKLGGNMAEFKQKGEAKAQYFTTDQKRCSNHADDRVKKDSNSLIVKAQWFKNTFGQVQVNQFPKHLAKFPNIENNSGSQCFGFACFVQWYLCKENNSDFVQGKCVAQGKWGDMKFLRQYVQPGDILRVLPDSYSNVPHSMVVYSVEDEGIAVLDCNFWNKAEKCRVALHIIGHDYAKWKGRPVYVYRGERKHD